MHLIKEFNELGLTVGLNEYLTLEVVSSTSKVRVISASALSPVAEAKLSLLVEDNEECTVFITVCDENGNIIDIEAY